MIIGEELLLTDGNCPDYMQGEDNYDYLFKRKPKEQRQQKKEEKKQRKVVKNQEREKRQQGGKRLPLLQNFGLFKKKTVNTTSPTASSMKNETSDRPETSETGAEETAQNTMQEKSNSGISSKKKPTTENVSDKESKETANEQGEILPIKENSKDAKPKEAGYGAALGFSFLGIMLLLAGIAVVRGGKSTNPAS